MTSGRNGVATSRYHGIEELPEIRVEMGSHSQSWLSTITVALSNFSIQWNFGSIAIALLMMSSEVCTMPQEQDCREGKQASWVVTVSSSVVFVGAVIGQLVMGRLGDLIGRSKALLVTTGIATVSSAMQAIAPAGSPKAIYIVIILFRFFLGIGIGGVYPLSATKAVEDSGGTDGDAVSLSNRKAVAAGKGFFWQMPGMMGPYLLSYMFTFSSMSVNTKWRLELGFGAIPSGLAMICLALEMRKDKAQKGVTENVAGAASVGDGQSSHTLLIDSIPAASSSSVGDEDSPLHMPTTSSFPSPPLSPSATATATAATKGGPVQPSNLSVADIFSLIASDSSIRRRLYGTGVCWFLFDVVVYGIGLISPLIIANIIHDTGDITSDESIRSLSRLSLGTMALSIPGTLMTIWIIPYKGVKWIQVVGFAVMALSTLCMGVLFSPLRNDVDGLFAVYCVLSLTTSIGVGISTYVLPALLFERKIRSTFNGMCAAMGKVGAFVGSMTFSAIARSANNGTTVVMILCFLVSTAACFLSQRYVVIQQHASEIGAGITEVVDPEKANENDPASSPPQRHAGSEVEVTNIIHEKQNSL